MKRFLLFLMMAVIAASAFALDFSLTPGGFAFIPMGKGSTDPATGNILYGLGGGGELGFEADLSTAWPNPLGLGYTLGIEAAMLANQLKSAVAKNISFYQAGGNIGLYFFPLSRLLVRADGAAGVYTFAGDKGTSDPGLFWRGGGKIGFRFTPGFTLAANAGWRQFSSGSVIQNSGLYAGLTAQITFQTGKGAEGIAATLNQDDPVYPAFMQLYQTNSAGAVVIRNNENAEIRDLRLYFRAGNYTASEFPCGSLSIIPRGRSVELPLLADFSNDILRFTDTGRIMGELVIRYKFLGQERETVRAVTVAAHDRNTIPLGDPSVFAAFVSTSSPEVLDIARTIAGLERAARRTGHNANASYAMWLTEALKTAGLHLATRDNTAVQFPAETLVFSSGTSRDIALLAASCFESVGMATALIQTENELLVAVSLNIGQSAAETLFNGTDKILIVDDTVWLPLSMSALADGFTACWTKAAGILNKAFSENQFVDFIIVEDAWQSYPAAPLPELGRTAVKIDNATATFAANNAIQLYIQQEIYPIIQRISASSATNTPANQNRLGILFARAGNTAYAKAAYEYAASIGSIPAMTNRGNLALSERDYAAAEYWFSWALYREPNNRTAQRGLEQIAGRR